MSGPTASAFAITAAGALVGGTVRGLTGFGSAIVAVLFWVVAGALSLDPGPLPVVVVTDAISSTIAAIPIAVLARAWTHADWRLVVTLTASKAAFAPLGAVALLVLDQQIIELVMGGVLLLLLLLMTVPGIGPRCWQAAQWVLHRLRIVNPGQPANSLSIATSSSSSACDENGANSLCHLPQDPASPGVSALSAHTDGVQPLSSGTSSALLSGARRPEEEETQQLLRRQAPGQEEWACASGQQAGHMTLLLPPSVRPAPWQGLVSLSRSNSLKGLPGASLDCEAQPLLAAKPITGLGVADSCMELAQQPGDTAGCAAERSQAAAGTGERGRWWGWVHKAVHFLCQRDNQLVIVAGTAAGCASGLMDGMTGMGGPPIMMLYMWLLTPKVTARAIGALLNITQIRIVAYFTLGIINRSDLALYITCALLHLTGTMVAGAFLFPRVDQVLFNNVLNVLVAACCMLLFAAAAGVTQQHTNPT